METIEELYTVYFPNYMVLSPSEFLINLYGVSRHEQYWYFFLNNRIMKELHYALCIVLRSESKYPVLNIKRYWFWRYIRIFEGGGLLQFRDIRTLVTIMYRWSRCILRTLGVKATRLVVSMFAARVPKMPPIRLIVCRASITECDKQKGWTSMFFLVRIFVWLERRWSYYKTFEFTVENFVLYLNECNRDIHTYIFHNSLVLLRFLSFHLVYIYFFLCGSTALWTMVVFSFLNPMQSRYDSLDKGTAHRKATTYTQTNINTE